MPAMASKKPVSDRSEKRTTSIRLPPVLLEVMDKIAEDHLTDRTNEFINACREYAERLGYWPPKPKEEKQ